jgi:hypothetical protein
MQHNPDQALSTVLFDLVRSGASLFQGSHISVPAKSIINQNQDKLKPHFLDLKDHNRIIEYQPEDQVISVQTGITIGQLNESLALNGQYLPCLMPEDYSICEIINAGSTGYFEHAYGLRSLLLGLEVVLPNGQIINTGGKVVKNVSGYDLTKLFIGAHGTLGVPSKAHLRVFARPAYSVTLVAYGLQLDALLQLSRSLIKTGLPLSGLEIFVDQSQSVWREFLENEAVSSRLSFRSAFAQFNLSKLPSEALLVTIGEHEDVMSELIAVIEEKFLRCGCKMFQLESTIGNLVEEAIDRKFDIDFGLVCTAVSASQFNLICDALKRFADVSILYRSGSGSLKLKWQSEEQLSDAIKLMSQIEGLGSIDISHSNDQFELIFDRLPKNDEALAKIKASIKLKFDPGNNMNPLVKL